MKKNTPFPDTWVFRMAWRDSRSHRRRLLLFVTSIVFGVAAIVSIGSFGANIERAINEQAKTLLGADLMFSSLRPFIAEVDSVIAAIGGEQVREFAFGSMALFPKTGNSRLVQVRAVDAAFPFYGAIGTEPPEAAGRYQAGRFALVDESLALQLGVTTEDSIRIGKLSLQVIGSITRTPAEPPVASTFNPTIFIPARLLAETALLQPGSLINYRVYFRLNDAHNADTLAVTLGPLLDEHHIRVETIASRKQRVGKIMENLYRFLNLVGFVALILGSIGVASAVHVYINQKLGDVAVLRCVGASSKQTFQIYLIQVAAMALVGSCFGAALGIVVQAALPGILLDFLPVQIAAQFLWGPIVDGMLVGLGLAMLFALLPLLSVRNVSPFFALRAAFEITAPPKDKSRWLTGLAIVATVAGFFVYQSANWIFGLLFAAVVMLAFAILAGVARLITVSVRKFFPKSWSYVWRQGLANLYRPNNQTLVLMVAVGLGTFLITTLYLTHDTLLSKVSYVAGGNRPNMLIYDIQSDQIEAVSALFRGNDVPIIQSAPMVTMRIAAINAERTGNILSDSTRRASRGLLRWEYRTTYRDSLINSEEIIAGEWVGHARQDAGIFPISFEEGAAERLQLALGDTIIWDVQGVPLITRISSFRKVDWQRIQANFMVVFPTGALEDAPQIHILAAKTSSSKASAGIQKALVQAFPNVSIIDLKLVLHTLDALLNKVAFAIRFMAFFSILAGLLVLSAAVVTSRLQRVQETVLLRTLGASRNQVTRIMVIEYLFLGSFASITGLVLAYGTSWALAVFIFESAFLPTFLPFLLVTATVVGLTILIGMASSRGILSRPPLEILRAEG